MNITVPADAEATEAPALPHQPPQQPAPLTPVAVVAREEVEPREAPLHRRPCAHAGSRQGGARSSYGGKRVDAG
ncbi:hypothetical protein OsI_35798 [Oryza sativa Indica Group]|uniref:Uncharacterized protein n=1 Tax=Oryza sativa subsp. indica TaxID=39946 RepID=B8BK21_ORYSI|nr:hypothetical protein OsI_35798 [Oryza sativa Indica Group]